MTKKLLIGFAALVVGAVVAAPTAQAAAPPAQAFATVFFNGQKLTTAPRPVMSFGRIQLENKTIGAIACDTVQTTRAFNEITEGVEKGFLDSTGYMTFLCEAATQCKVHNTKGELVEGIYLTAEAPPTTTGTETHNAGITSLPWTGEVIEREERVKQVLTKHVKIWVVFPPPPVGEGAGCLGTEIEFEDAEGKAEKERGYELAPLLLNGAKNGLKPSHAELRGEEGLTEKEFPQTGRLKSLQVGDAFLTAPKLVTGGLGGTWELVQVETTGPVPSVTKVEPNHGPKAGGTSVTITGTGFIFTPSVTFGGNKATSVVVNSEKTSMTAVSPAGTKGLTVDVRVATEGGFSAVNEADRFTYE
jgi:hypothetical protein